MDYYLFGIAIIWIIILVVVIKAVIRCKRAKLACPTVLLFDCSDDPAWIYIFDSTVLVHSCLHDDDDGEGTAEIVINMAMYMDEGLNPDLAVRYTTYVVLHELTHWASGVHDDDPSHDKWLEVLVGLTDNFIK